MTEPILVTGGCGFVGRHLVTKLLKDGNEIHIVDNLSTGIDPNKWLPSEFKGKYTFFKIDALEYFSKIIEESKFSDVYHLSAVVGGRIKIDKDPIAVAMDLAIDSLFFNWLTKSKCERVLYASSSAAYPTDLQSEENSVELQEDMINFDKNLGKPDMTYGWSKLTGEYLSRLSAKYYGIHIACIRPFSGFGEDQDKTYPVPAITQRAVNKEDPLVVWGTGRQGRDFVHMDDCIDAMILAIDKISDGSGVNISSGKLTTFLEVAKIVVNFANYDPKIETLENMPQGVHARFGSTSLAKDLLGWSPKIDLEQGLKRVFDYLENNSQIQNLFDDTIN